MKMVKKYSYTELGMLFGMFIGSGIGITAFAFTNNALFFYSYGLWDNPRVGNRKLFG